MGNVEATLLVILLIALLIDVLLGWKSESRLRAVESSQARIYDRLDELVRRQDELRKHFFSVIRPVHQLSEDVDMIDDDLVRLKRIVESLRTKIEGDDTELTPPT